MQAQSTVSFSDKRHLFTGLIGAGEQLQEIRLHETHDDRYSVAWQPGYLRLDRSFSLTTKLRTPCA